MSWLEVGDGSRLVVLPHMGQNLMFLSASSGIDSKNDGAGHSGFLHFIFLRSFHILLELKAAIL